MIRILVAILLLQAGLLSFGQVIKGTVLDQETGEPISFASLFFDGTFVGTTTDERGHFELDVSKYSSRPLIISAMGYYSEVLTEFSPEKACQVLLSPRIFEIGEVSVSAESLARKRSSFLNIFRNEFLGRTGNARRCSILNEQDITFNYGSDQDTLKAFASKPIRIQNLALGYEETYYLDRFEYDRKSGNLSFTGNIIFTRDLNQGDSYNKSFARRRKYAYEGSRMHFFRTLWNNDLTRSPFSVKDSDNTELNYDQLVLKDEWGRSYLTYDSGLDIYYYSIRSYISFLEKGARFEEDGFFDPAALRWGGRMSLKRVADWLPYEYLLPQE
jgi:hypothetical protein